MEYTETLKVPPIVQRLTFRFRNFSVSRLLPIFKGFGFGKFGPGKKTRFRKIWSRKKGSVSVSENLVSEIKSQFQFLKIWYRKKVSVSVSENLVSEKSLSFGQFGRGRKVPFRKIWSQKSLGLVSESLISEKKKSK